MIKPHLLMYPHDSISFDIVQKEQSKSFLHLKNIAEHSVCFKLKTTSPKLYQVKPSKGLLSPNEESKIELTMNLSDGIPRNIEDKFLVETSIFNALSHSPVQKAKLTVCLNQFVPEETEVVVSETKESENSEQAKKPSSLPFIYFLVIFIVFFYVNIIF